MKWAALLLLTAAFGCAPPRFDTHRRMAADPVHASERIHVEGASLFLQARGADRRAPVLVWLHGGPGGAERPLFRYFNARLEKHFLVVYWDQRGAGRSFDPEADPGRLTIARQIADLDTLLDRIREKWGPHQIVLVGHSWGAALALLYARAHPDGVSAVVGVSPLISTLAAQRSEYAFVRSEALQRQDGDVLARLQQLGPPPYASAAQVLAVERLDQEYGGVFHRPPHRFWMILRGLLGGLVTPWEIPRFIRGNEVSLKAMHDELLGLDLRQSVPELNVPVIFMLGRYDRHVDARVAAAYLDQLKAPSKDLIWFEHSAHNVPFEEPGRFDEEIVSSLQSIGIGRK